MENQKFTIESAQSNINWVGRKVTGAHNGTIGIKSGWLTLTGNKLTGGEFSIDTTSINFLDFPAPATNVQFFGHLASDDFFSIDKYPEASLQITSVTDNHI